MYAAGKIPGSFFKREGRAGEKATLIARMIDRPLRPLFPKGWRRETQLVTVPLSIDHVHPYDILGDERRVSAALMISDIPFPSPVGAVRIGKVDGNFVVNPTEDAAPRGPVRPRPGRLRHRRGHPDGRGRRQRDPRGRDPRRARHRARRDQEALSRAMHELAEKAGKAQARGHGPGVRRGPARPDQGARSATSSTRRRRCSTSSSARTRPRPSRTRSSRSSRGDESATDYAERRGDRSRSSTSSRSRSSASASPSRRSARTAATRRDPPISDRGRPAAAHARLRAVHPRPDAGPLRGRPRHHARGDAPGHARAGDDASAYFHHYNFPPFSVGEAGFMRGPKRRDIGHGALAERALVPMIPDAGGLPVHDSRRVGHPRVQRLVVDGVGLRLVAVADGRGRADQGAGRGHRHGPDQGGRRLRRAHRHRRRRGPPRRHGLQGRRHRGGHHRPPDGHQDHGRHVRHPARRAHAGQATPALFILGEMAKVIDAPREQMSDFAPRISSIKIDPDKIGLLIGKGGETIRSLQEEFEAQIDVDDTGQVRVYAATGAQGDGLVDRIRSMTKEVEIGDTFTGKVVKTMPFGAFIELAKGTDGLLHISNIAAGPAARDGRGGPREGPGARGPRGRGRPRARPHRPAPRRRPRGRRQGRPRSWPASARATAARAAAATVAPRRAGGGGGGRGGDRGGGGGGRGPRPRPRPAPGPRSRPRLTA